MGKISENLKSYIKDLREPPSPKEIEGLSESLKTLPEESRKKLIDSIGKHLLSNLLNSLQEEDYCTNLPSKKIIKEIINISPSLIVNLFGECYKISDFSIPLKFYEYCLFSGVRHESLSKIVNDPQTHFFDILENILNNEEYKTKEYAVYVLIQLNDIGEKFIERRLYSSDGADVKAFMFNLIAGGYFIRRYSEQRIYKIFNLLEPKLLANLVEYALKKFQKDWKWIQNDFDALLENNVLKTLSYLKHYKHPISSDNYETEIVQLIETIEENRDLLCLILNYEYLLDFLQPNELSNLFNGFNVEEVAKKFLNLIRYTKEPALIERLGSSIEVLGELSFPLLKELVEEGDSQAKEIFKKEIAKRFKTGHFKVVNYLLNNRYLNNFKEEELVDMFKNFDYERLSH